VLQADPDYCRYILKEVSPDSSPRLIACAEWLKTQDVPAVLPLVNFDKHEGTSYEEVLRADPDYCSFILQAVSPDINSDLKFVEWLKAQAVVPSGSSLVSFGKYKGKSYEEVLERDPQYCSYILTNYAPSQGSIGSSTPFIEWLKAQDVPQDVPARVINFGKYRGWTYEEVLEGDPQYCSYMLGNVDFARNPSLAAFREWLGGQVEPS